MIAALAAKHGHHLLPWHVTDHAGYLLAGVLAFLFACWLGWVVLVK